MRIHFEASAGGVVVLVVIGVLLSGHGSDVSSALTAAIIFLIVFGILAVAVVAGLVVYRSRHRDDRQWYPPPYAVREIRADVVPPSVQAAERPALEPPAMRLHPDQLAELAEILRRHQAGR